MERAKGESKKERKVFFFLKFELSLSAFEAGLAARAAWSRRKGDGEQLQCSNAANFHSTSKRDSFPASEITMYSPYCLTQVKCIHLINQSCVFVSGCCIVELLP